MRGVHFTLLEPFSDYFSHFRQRDILIFFLIGWDSLRTFGRDGYGLRTGGALSGRFDILSCDTASRSGSSDSADIHTLFLGDPFRKGRYLYFGLLKTRPLGNLFRGFYCL